jgi:hypothetical protein
MESLLGDLYANKWIMFHGIPNISLGPYKRDGSNAKLGAWQAIELSLALRCYYISIVGSHIVLWFKFFHKICCGPSTWSTFTLHSAWGSIICKIIFLFAWSKGPSNYSYGSWSVFKGARGWDIVINWKCDYGVSTYNCKHSEHYGPLPNPYKLSNILFRITFMLWAQHYQDHINHVLVY